MPNFRHQTVTDFGSALARGDDIGMEKWKVTRSKNSMGVRGRLAAEAARVLKRHGSYVINAAITEYDHVDELVPTVTVIADCLAVVGTEGQPRVMSDWQKRIAVLAEAGRAIPSPEVYISQAERFDAIKTAGRNFMPPDENSRFGGLSPEIVQQYRIMGGEQNEAILGRP
jgi:hypothetical protein